MSRFTDWFKQNYQGNEGKTLQYEDETGNKKDILMKLAQKPQVEQTQAPIQQVPEGMNFFNAKAANKDLSNKIDDKMEKAQEAKLNDPSGSIEDKKPNKDIVGAIGDLGSALAGPTQTIDTGTYSTFQPEDTMASMRQQVLKNMKMRG